MNKVVICIVLLVVNLSLINALDFCENGSVSKNELVIKSINDELIANSYKWAWNPGINVGIKVSVENKNYSNEDFTLELIFVDGLGREVEFVKDSRDLSQGIVLANGSSNDILFDFFLSNSILLGSYELYAKLYQGGGDIVCTSLKAENELNYTKIIVSAFDHQVMLEEVVGPSDVMSGSNVTFQMNVVNIGKNIEPKVKIKAYSLLLNLDEKMEIENLKVGESRNINFNFPIYGDVFNETRKITFLTEFDYNLNKSFYEQNSKEEDDRIAVIKLIEPNVTLSEVANGVFNNNLYEDLDEDLSENNLTTFFNQSLSGNFSNNLDMGLIWFFSIVAILILSILIVLFFLIKKVFNL